MAAHAFHKVHDLRLFGVHLIPELVAEVTKGSHQNILQENERCSKSRCYDEGIKEVLRSGVFPCQLLAIASCGQRGTARATQNLSH